MPIFNQGDEVRLKSRPDRVGVITGTPTLVAGEYWYPVFFGPGRRGRHPQHDIEKDQITADVGSLFCSGKFASRDALSKLYTHLRLVTSIKSQIYAIGASRTNFYTYQFKPLMKFLDSTNHRLLIADEVGLGKTIEAGLILTELKKRKELKRILIVPPAHLVSKWQIEMRNRFELDFDVLDKRGIHNFLKDYGEEGDEAILKGILSLQTLRSRSLTEQWEAVAPHLDIVIFDEAGRLRNPGTRSHNIAAILIENSDDALLLTATPVQTSDEDLFNLLSLLDPVEFDNYELFKTRLEANEPVLKALNLLRVSSDDLTKCLKSLQRAEKTPLKKRFVGNPLYSDVIFRLDSIKKPTLTELIEIQRDINSLNVFGHVINRTRKKEVHEAKAIRQAKVVTVEPTSDEIEFYQLITALCQKEFEGSLVNNVTSFVAITRQRQVSSCMFAMLDYYEEKLDELDDVESSDFSLEDFDLNSDDKKQNKNRKPIIGDYKSWEKRLAKKDSKWEKFFELITNLEKEESGRKIVVFSYFKKTLSYLRKKLKDANILCEVISGDVPTHPDDPEKDIRGKCIDNFKTNPEIRILLSTEVGSEGIDLQFSHILINYDLPWNPMVVEQRIGRLDRLGQEAEKIIIFNLSMKGTIEDKILQRLYHRLGIFEKSIGDLEAVLGEEIRHMTRDLFSRHLSQKEQEARIEQAAEVIKRRHVELEEFEEAASSLLGHDEFFVDEINRAKNNHRYIDGQELILYLKDFLSEHYKYCQLEEAKIKGLFNCIVNDELRFFVRKKIPSDDLGLRLFLNRSSKGSIKMTTDSKLAQEDRKMDYLTFHHPLIRAITYHYDEHTSELHPVSHVILKTKACPVGAYAWFLYLMEITGARPIKDINVVIIPVASMTPLNEEASEKLFMDMVLNGQVVTPGERGIDDLPSHELLKIAEDSFVKRLNKKLEQRRRFNDAIVSNRLASIEESFTRNLERREILLEKSKITGKKQSYIKGLETGMRNLKVKYEDSRLTIESTRNIGKAYDLKGAGIVEILHG